MFLQYSVYHVVSYFQFYFGGSFTKYLWQTISGPAIQDFANAKDTKEALKRASRGFSMSTGVRMMYYSVMIQAYSEKEIQSAPIRSQT